MGYNVQALRWLQIDTARELKCVYLCKGFLFAIFLFLDEQNTATPLYRITAATLYGEHTEYIPAGGCFVSFSFTYGLGSRPNRSLILWRINTLTDYPKQNTATLEEKGHFQSAELGVLPHQCIITSIISQPAGLFPTPEYPTPTTQRQSFIHAIRVSQV